jgi:hypothetical protein
MNALQQLHALPIVVLASPVYWPDPVLRDAAVARVKAELEQGSPAPLEFHVVTSPECVERVVVALRGRTAALLPLSGAVQPWMVSLARSLGHLGLANAYLAGFLSPSLAAELLDRNAHPACTDFFAHQRLAQRPVRWLATMADVHALARANQAVARLRQARILKIGETEPWVINSTREPARFREALGCTVLPVAADDLYREFRTITDGEAARMAEDWVTKASRLDGPARVDVVRATRVLVAMRSLLDRHGADALSMACFAMIGELETTSCLALSTLNDSADAIGACEGDLDAAVTLYLLKALGADFVWIANPIIHAANCIDLAHCTAPRCACGGELSYRLLRHHESGRGVAPEVALPTGRPVTLVRIGADLTELCVHPGRTARAAKQPTCHTQIRVQIPSSRDFLNTLNGTHVVLTYGDRRSELALCADLLGLRLTGATAESFASGELAEPPPLPICSCCSSTLTPQPSTAH